MTGTLTIHWRRPPGYDGWSVHDSDLGWLQTFETLAEAEAWVIAEGERRDAEPTP
jgi:hypothetical protein